MTEQGRHAAPEDPAAFARPPGVTDPFEPRAQPPAYTPPPPTVAPADAAAFGRPPGAAAFDAPPGARLAPRPTPQQAVPRMVADAFGRTPSGGDGFDPAPGTRIAPAGSEPQSPWWRRGAERDPWRDPSSPFWLGRGAVFAGGSPAQLDPSLDVEQGEDEPVAEEPAADAPASNVRGGRFGLSTLMLALVVALVAGAIGGGAGYFIAHNASNSLHHSDVSFAQSDTPANRPPNSVAGIAKRVGPAVVSIAVQTPDVYGVGSGVVIDKDGDVLTNNHVVAAAAGVSGATITVTFSNEDTARAQIVGRDPVSDLAVIKVPDDQLTVATLGNSAKLAVGDPVIAIGSPLGLQGTVTAGIVSALNRAVHVFGDNGQSDAYLDAIQTDASINPGNSGGALVDAAGAVVGINSAAQESSNNGGASTPTSGIGYAIPIDYAEQVAAQLIRSGHATHGSLDAQGRTATSGLQEGAYLEQVVPNGAAANAGLRNGDVIIVAGGRLIQTFDQLEIVVQEQQPGDSLQVTYLRGASKQTTTVKLGSA